MKSILLVTILFVASLVFGSANPINELQNKEKEQSSIALEKSKSVEGSKPHGVLDNDDEPERPKYKKVRRIALIIFLAGLVSIASLFYIPLLIIPVTCTLVALIMFLISMDMKRKWKKKNDPTYTKNKGAWSIVGQVVGWIGAGFVAGAGIFAWLYFGLDL